MNLLADKEVVMRELKADLDRLRTKVTGFKARKGQNYMIALVTNTLFGKYANKSGKKTLVVEGQTGVGKTLGYLLPSLRIQKEHNKKLKPDSEDRLKIVIATANVALQEQILNSDFTKARSIGYKPSAALALGRGRFICMSNAEKFGAEASEAEQTVIHKLIDKLNSGWSGTKDTIPLTVNDKLWSKINATPSTCTKSDCPHAKVCPFLKNRAEVSKADLIVANHSMICSDQNLKAGGGRGVLPDTDKTLFIVDEAHHFADIVRENNTNSVNINEVSNAVNSAAQIKRSLGALSSKASLNIDSDLDAIKTACGSLKQLVPNLEFDLTSSGPVHHSYENSPSFVGVKEIFEHQVGAGISNLLSSLNNVVDKLSEDERLSEVMSGPLRADYERIAHLTELLERFHNTLKSYIQQKEKTARWISTNQQKNTFSIQTASLRTDVPIQRFIKDAFAVVFTSATIRSLGKFASFNQKMGFEKDQGVAFAVVESPFPFEQSKLITPKHLPEPTINNMDRYLIELAKSVEHDFSNHKAGLLLFSSKKAMEQFVGNASAEMKAVMRKQYEKPRSQLIQEHSKAIKRGERSLLVGTQSFSEGLDLPGNLLTYVGITKVPFADSSGPIDKALDYYSSLANRSSFMEHMLPEACSRLIQSAGRLNRSIYCSGELFIYDKRVLTKRYGSQLLDSLPPFSRAS